MEALYDMQSVRHSYRGQTVLAIDHLTVTPASIVGLVGPNGSGKSTLLRLMGLIERPTEGEIRYKGHLVGPFSLDARRQITLLPQESFMLKRSVFENVSYGLKLRNESAHVEERVKEALAMVNLSSDIFSQRPWYALSGGEAQRVALAARLVLKPKVLLLDEPTAGVDAGSAELIREASLRAREELGTTLVIASHDRQWLNEVCDEILPVFRGRILEKGHENILFGPWIRLESGWWGKQLSGAQHLKVSPPPKEKAVLVVDGLSLMEEAPVAGGGDFILQGTVTRCHLERSTGRILATVFAENHSFTVVLTSQERQERKAFPGQTVFICYDPKQFRWI